MFNSLGYARASLLRDHVNLVDNSAILSRKHHYQIDIVDMSSSRPLNQDIETFLEKPNKINHFRKPILHTPSFQDELSVAAAADINEGDEFSEENELD